MTAGIFPSQMHIPAENCLLGQGNMPVPAFSWDVESLCGVLCLRRNFAAVCRQSMGR